MSHFENLPQRLPIVLAAALIAGAALAVGQLAIRALRLHKVLDPWERIPLAYGLGTIGLALMTLALGRLGGLGPWTIRVGLGFFIAAELSIRTWSFFRFRHPPTPALPRKGGGSQISEGGTLILAPSPLVGEGRGGGSIEEKTVARWSGNWLWGRKGAVARGPSPNAYPLLPIVLIAGPFLVVMALGAMLPTFDYDAIEYHLEGPKEYFQGGRIAFLPHNVYTSMPFGVEMLHLLGMEVVDDWWMGAMVGQLLVALFAPATAAMIALTARRWASRRAAWVGAVVYLTTPWVYRLAMIPYVEGPLCYFHAALIWAALRAWEAEPADRARLWAVVGLLAGGAMACKYPALLSAVLPFGALAAVDACRRRSWPIALAFAAALTIAIGPWLAKNAVDTGNPVYPLAYNVFGGRHWDADRDARWQAIHGPKGDRSALALIGTRNPPRAGLLDIAGRSDWQSPLYTALAPLAFLRKGSRRRALILAGYAASIFLTWWLWTHRLDRFWLPILPPLAILAGLGADWTRHREWSALLAILLAVGIGANLVYTSTALAGNNEWTADLNAMRLSVPKALNPALTRLDDTLPPGAKILTVGQAAVFYVRHPIVYNTVFNVETIETLARDRTPAQVAADLRRLGVAVVYVDWGEIARFRSPGNYGFTPFVTPDLFARLVAEGILAPPERIGPRQDAYRVRTR